MEPSRRKRMNSDRHHRDLAPKLPGPYKLMTLQVAGHVPTTLKLPIEKFTVRITTAQHSPWLCLKLGALNRNIKTGKKAQGILQPTWPGTASSASLWCNPVPATALPLPSISGEAVQRENRLVESGAETLRKGAVKKWQVAKRNANGTGPTVTELSTRAASQLAWQQRLRSPGGHTLDNHSG